MIKYMIGDWVVEKDRVCQVSFNTTIEEIRKEDCATSASSKTQYYDIEPIPLTQELLYKNTYDEASNTYHVYNTAGYVQYCITDRFVVKCYTYGEKEVFKYEGLILEYVHDLQHLLEIARIDKKIVL